MTQEQEQGQDSQASFAETYQQLNEAEKAASVSFMYIVSL